MKEIFQIIFLLFNTFLVVHNRTAITGWPYTGTIPATGAGATGLQFQYDMTGIASGTDLHVTFQILNSSTLSSTFVMISTNQTKFQAGGIYPKYFYGKSHAQLQAFMDLNGMQLGRKQFINRKKNNILQTFLYFTVYNIDMDYRRVPIEFKIDFTSTNDVSNPNLGCFSCNSGVRVNSAESCLCTNCGAGFYGPDCSINLIPLISGQTTIANINGPAQAFFKIQQSSQVSINVKQRSGRGQVYFQFINFAGSFAHHSNVAVGSSLQGRFLVTAANGATIGATSSGTPMSITVSIYEQVNTVIEIGYSVPQKSNILIIVLGILGGVLFIGLIIAAIYIIRNSNWYQGSRQVRPSRPTNENLSDEQIQRFFPTVIYQNVQISKNESTLQNIKNNDQMKRQTLQDCVICLCPVQKTQQIKVTYCKHLFHSHCLVGWFKKQQNCPYCRQQFTRSNTIKLYRKLKEMSSNNIMKRQELVIAILSNKSSIIASKQSLEMLNQKQTQTRKIQIGSRNSFDVQVQNMQS